MNSKNKKSKHRKKLSDDLPDMKDIKKPLFKEDDVNNNIRSDSENRKEEIRSSRRRKHTKVSRKSQDNDLNNIILDDKNYKGKQVRFAKIDVIDVESWKKLNLKLTAEENLDELIRISEGKKERIKNVSCTCIII